MFSYSLKNLFLECRSSPPAKAHNETGIVAVGILDTFSAANFKVGWSLQN
jgi:hypothetical protein